MVRRSSIASEAAEPARSLRGRARPAPAVGALLGPAVDRVLHESRGRLKDADEVHDLRVACRRLRAGLWLFGDGVGRKRRRRLDRALSRLSQVLGAVRECDVLMAAEGLDADQRRDIRRQRRRALTRVHERLSQAPGRRLRRRLQHLRARLSQDPAFAQPLRADLIEDALARRRHRLQQRLPTARCGDPDALHRLRIQVKKLRYCMELLQDALPASRRQCANLERLRRAQDRLGDWNDQQSRFERGMRPLVPAAELEDLLDGLARTAMPRPGAASRCPASSR